MSDSTSSDKQLNLGAACFRCRGFRHACDRRKPSCSRCHRRGIDCVYPEAAPTLKNLQKATETLGERIMKFSDKIKTEVTCQPTMDPSSPMTDSTVSIYSEEDEDTMSEKNGPKRRSRASSKVASTSNFSVYPCTKCFKDLQQCDLTLPKCSRCEANNFECIFKKSEPKANHVAQVLTTMNKVMDQWQDSIDRITREFAQKTRELSSKANFMIKPIITPPTAWRINSTKKGLSIESNVNSYHDLSTMVDQVKQTVTITPREEKKKKRKDSTTPSTPHLMDEPIIEFDDTSSVHTTSGFAIWDQWSHPTHAMPQDYPIDISQELTDNLIELYFRTSCCSSIRLPIIDATDFLLRYRDPDPAKRPSTVLIYAVCAMSARNAFQLHVWSKRPSFGAPQYNMGKALSVAYCLRGREQLADCFDEPTFDNCQAAFLLSYCNYQNGYPGVIYFYEWIAYTMALQLGLYDEGRELTRYQSMLIWCIYYCNAWYKSLQGSNNGNANGVSQCKPKSALPSVLDRPDQILLEQEGVEPNEQAVDYYVWNTWVYLIKLQVLRDQSIAKLVSYQMNGRLDTNLPQDLLAMQETLKEFHQSLPTEWQSPNLGSVDNKHPSCSSKSDSNETYHVDLKSFSRYCINFVSLHYSTNQIILYQAFVPVGRLPSTPISIQCLETCLNAASNICQILELMMQDCHVPLVGFLFASIVYRKLLSYPNEHYYELGKFALLRSVETSKASINFKYDFEMARTLVCLMERDIQLAILHRSSSSSSCFVDSSVDGSPSPSIPSPPNYNSLSQAIKEW
ncbi:hypothetical protein BDF21DRAFT_360173 [Thamnidium elegans]|uniref:Zn(2)-C6 fungal-type domain-containing protein n=1 Tax=Thamnidium elegans TaxID=101142 RepID=A0A8H7SNN5_9FUNG|nr:hypothetical protein INT48_009083 [Thamnidium elegans]KAI8083506.1 hypothetical protein BDF21DRAFT_360173 [Thamnidium elegans]